MKKKLLCIFIICGMLVVSACSSGDDELPGLVPANESASEETLTPAEAGSAETDDPEGKGQSGSGDETGNPANAGDEDPSKEDNPGAGDPAGAGEEDPSGAGDPDDPSMTGDEPGGAEDPSKTGDEPGGDSTGAGEEDPENPGAGEEIPEDRVLEWNESWEFADYSIIHEDSPTLYYSHAAERKGIVVSVNAGHGTPGGNKVKTLCHPDGSEKVTGGSTSAGATKAAAVSSGTTFLDGTEEGVANLSLAFILKDMLLEEGYDVLMIREDNDTQLDNIARTVYSNNYADCHIALHYDSSESDKGFFFIGVPDIASYRAMEPVASHWREHNALGEALLEGIGSVGVKICGSGNIPLDLTQTSYSTIPSVDVEVGDRKSDYGEKTQREIARGLVAGINIYFGQ